MTKFSGILRILLLAGFVLAAVAMPWVRAGSPGGRGDATEHISLTTDAKAEPCCCGSEEPCPCCVAAADTGDDKSHAKPCSDCRCGEGPANTDTASVFLLLTGITPVGWRPPTPVEIVTAPATPIASACRILARCLPVTNTAQRLALTGVRTT